MNLGWPNMFQPSPLGWFMALGLLFIHNSPVVALFQWPETWELPGPRPKTGSSGPATAPAVPSSDPSLAIGCSGTTCENVDPFGDPKMWPFCPTRMIQFFGYSPITFRKWWWSMIDLNWKTSWQLILKKSQVSFSSQSQGLMEQNALNISWVRNWVSKDLDEKNCISNWFQNHGFLLPPPHIFSWPRSRFGKAFQNVTEISIKDGIATHNYNCWCKMGHRDIIMSSPKAEHSRPTCGQKRGEDLCNAFSLSIISL